VAVNDSRHERLLASVIVPVRGMDAQVLLLLDALERQTVSRDLFEIVLADDGGGSRSLAALATRDGHIRVLQGPRSNSYAARNRAIAGAGASILACCDADCVPEPQWIEQGMAALEHADVAAGLIRLIAPERPTIWAMLDASTFLDQERAVRSGYAVTANLCFRRELFERVGGFDDTLPNQGDYDFVSRCVAAGATLSFAPGAVVRHPTRTGAGPFLRKVWAVNRRYAERESGARRRPEGTKLRNWAPVVQTARGRKHVGRPLGLDRQRLAECGIHPSLADRLRALPLLYLLVPYVAGVAQVVGWWAGRGRRASGGVQVMLVCSSGGHLLQLLRMKEAWTDFTRVWVTLEGPDTRWLLRDEQVVYAHGPTFRNVRNLIRNTLLAWRVIGVRRPRVILTTGAALAVPFAWIGRLRGVRIVYVESLTRVDTPSLSCRLARPVASRVYVQWPELLHAVPSARYVGSVFSIR